MAGDTIAGRYRLLQELGQGAMSSVWLAEDVELGRRVAVKALGPAADRARFEREAKAAAALSHPHICQVYDYGEYRGRPFMVLEYLGGGTLEDRLRRRSPLPDGETQRIARELASALAHAHARGLVHRDLKPSNVLFDHEGRAKIADFGIARMGEGGTLTDAGTVLGTAAYLSPEQAAGEPATAASDVYSFGVILFRALTGRLPFESQNAMELVRMHRDDPPPTVEQLRPDAPPRLAALASAALAKDAAARPRDGAALLAELGAPTDTVTQILPPLPPPDATAATQVVRRPHPPPRRRSATPLVAAAGAALLLAGGAVAFIATRGDGDSSPPTTTPHASVTLPTVAPETTRPTTTEPETTQLTTTTEPTTTRTQPTTTAEPTTTARPTTTRTQPTTTSAPTTQPTTSAPVTTQPTTTESFPTTTETLPTTTETAPTTTVATSTDTVTVPAPGAAG
jgi:serine/threonine-protein kinase